MKDFHLYLTDQALTTQQESRNLIKELDSSTDDIDEKTYEGGCEHLLDWFNSFR